MARNFETTDLGFTARFKKQQGQVFAEDKEILEAQQRAIHANPSMRLAAYRIDEGGVRARQLISRSIKSASPDPVA
jgi:vanillate O-demethylase monooxygenase subunit